MKKIIPVAVILVLVFICMREFRPAGNTQRTVTVSRSADESSAATGMSSNKKSTEAAAPATSGSLCSTAEVTQILQRHNQARAAVGVHRLTWSPDLAHYAQEWADHLAAAGCRFEHRPESSPGQQKYGENLFMGTAGYYGVKEAVDAWVNEKQFYQGQPIDKTNYHAFGHYTQVVWKGTKQVGCGKALCNGKVIIVCNYAPAGNVIGSKAW